MTIQGTLRQFVEGILKSARITSASPPPYYNRVDALNWYGEAGNFEEILRADVVNIIKDEIQIQMTQVGDPIADKKAIPTGSSEAQAISGIKKGIGYAQNPSSMATNLISALPHAALIALAVSLVPLIINELTRDGGLMDTRWKRELDKEINIFLDRQTQRNTQIGIRGVTIQSRAGFIGINGANNSNNLRDIKAGGVDETRLDRIGINGFAKGEFSIR